MEIFLEKPVTWINSKLDGQRHDLMYINLRASLKTLNLEFHESITRRGEDFRRREPPKHGILLSYHSVGRVKRVWRLKETPIPYYYAFDRYGYSGWSELSVESQFHLEAIKNINQENADEFCDQLSEWLVSNNLSKYKQKNLTYQRECDFIFFPLQVLSDTVAQHNRVPMLAILKKSAELAEQFRVPLVVKRHPLCKSINVYLELLKLRRKYKYFKTTKNSVNELLPACRGVIVGNSGVGLEALVHGKRVFSFAGSEYSLAVGKIDTIDDLSNAFEPPPSDQTSAGKRFIYYYLNNFCFDCRNTNSIMNRLDVLLNNEWSQLN